MSCHPNSKHLSGFPVSNSLMSFAHIVALVSHSSHLRIRIGGERDEQQKTISPKIFKEPYATIRAGPTETVKNQSVIFYNSCARIQFGFSSQAWNNCSLSGSCEGVTQGINRSCDNFCTLTTFSHFQRGRFPNFSPNPITREPITKEPSEPWKPIKQRGTRQ